MLRFGSPASGKRPQRIPRERLRLWLLFGAACVVLLTMRMLRQPETAARIDSLFATPRPPENPATIGEVLAGEPGEVAFVPAASPLADDTAVREKRPALDQRFDLSVVRDNTYFRREENAAWFAVWDWLREVSADQLADESLGVITYAQMIDQPEVYRGHVVKVQGTVAREELLTAPPNESGIADYHRLMVRPEGGGVWPIVVYCLEVPAGFPQRDKLHAEVDFHGVFFKNWSYAWQNGLGLAPVVLAQTVNWHPKVTSQGKRPPVSLPGVIAAVASAAAIAAVVGWCAWRHTRRPLSVLMDHKVTVGPPADERQP